MPAVSGRPAIIFGYCQCVHDLASSGPWSGIRLQVLVRLAVECVCGEQVAQGRAADDSPSEDRNDSSPGRHDVRPDRPMVILTAATGLRSSELRGLTWDRVDVEKGMVMIDRQLVGTDSRHPAWGPPKTTSSGLGARTLRKR